MKILINNPAFEGLVPKTPKYALKNTPLNRSIKAKEIFFSKKKQKKFYFFENNKKKKFFLKKVRVNQYPSLMFLREITDFLLKKKINTPRINKFSKDIRDKNIFFIWFDYVNGKYLKAEKMDIILLAKNLSFLHKNLKKFNKKDLILKKTIKRMEDLEMIRSKYIKDTKKFKNFLCYKKIKSLLIEFGDINRFYKNLIKFSQCTHGDLVPGNVIKNHKKLFFLDLEDTSYSFYPVIFDIGLILERLVLINKKLKKKDKIKLIKTFFDNYKYPSKNKLNLDFKKVIKFLSIRSLLTEIKKFYHYENYSKKELNKFLKLYQKNYFFLK